MYLTSDNKVVVLYNSIFKVPKWINYITISPNKRVEGFECNPKFKSNIWTTNSGRHTTLDITVCDEKDRIKPNLIDITNNKNECIIHIIGYITSIRKDYNDEVFERLLNDFPVLNYEYLQYLKVHTNLCTLFPSLMQSLEIFITNKEYDIDKLFKDIYDAGYEDKRSEKDYDPMN